MPYIGHAHQNARFLLESLKSQKYLQYRFQSGTNSSWSKYLLVHGKLFHEYTKHKIDFIKSKLIGESSNLTL